MQFQIRGILVQVWQTNELTITMSTRHHVSFNAHKPVKEPVHVGFRTKAGKPVSFDAEKEVKEPVHVEFMAKNKRKG